MDIRKSGKNQVMGKDIHAGLFVHILKAQLNFNGRKEKRKATGFRRKKPPE